MRKWTKQIQRLGNINWTDGTATSDRLSNVAMGGLVLTFHCGGANEPSLTEMEKAIKRIYLSVAGQDDFEFSFRSLWDWNRRMLGRAPSMRVNSTQNWREITLMLPLNLENAIKPTDTLIDLRRVGTIIPNAYLRFELETSTNVVQASSYIGVSQHYYPLGDHERKDAFKRNIKYHELLPVAQGATFHIDLDYAEPAANLIGLQIRAVNTGASKSSKSVSVFEYLRVTGNQNGRQETPFDIRTDEIVALSRTPFNGQAGNTFPGDTEMALADSVIYYDFTRNNGGNNRSLKGGFLDVSDFSSLRLEGKFVARQSGRVELTADRVDVSFAGSLLADTEV